MVTALRPAPPDLDEVEELEAAVDAWLVELARRDWQEAQAAAAAGEPYVPLSPEEASFVAHVAVALGIRVPGS